MIEPLKDHKLLLFPSDNLLATIQTLHDITNTPKNIKKIQKEIKGNTYSNLPKKTPKDLFKIIAQANATPNDLYLTLADLIWMKTALKTLGKIDSKRPHLCQLIATSTIAIPKNKTFIRNHNLAIRCTQLRNQQLNREYRVMTQNVDNARTYQPRDTIAFHMHEINRQLIAVFQLIISILAGFVFGFVGVQLLIGVPHYVGFRLVLGMVCALIVAVAEMYFLVKKFA